MKTLPRIPETPGQTVRKRMQIQEMRTSPARQIRIPQIRQTAGTGTSENGSDGIYVVEEGDTLAIISRKMYGDVTHVDAICRMNESQTEI